MMEFATPTMKRKEPLTAAPGERDPGQQLDCSGLTVKIVRTNDTPNATHMIQLVKNISANGNGNILRHPVSRIPGVRNGDINIPQ
jgi:hypothetical protein